MKCRLIWFAAAAAMAFAGQGTRAIAGSVVDPSGDFLPSFTGAHDPDLDVVLFSVSFNHVNQTLNFGAVLAGAIDPSRPGLYVIGVDTGTGPIAPFGPIGQPNVRFNQAIVLRKNGTVTIGPNTLGSGSSIIAANMFAISVPISFLPSTGFTPDHYLVNLWPRNGLGSNSQISDFAPNNALLAGVPEPAAWTMTTLGFGVLGASLRRRRPRRTALTFV